MRTEDLIRAMVADMHVPARPVASSLAGALGVGFALTAIGFWIELAPRPDIASSLLTLRFDLKIVAMLLLAAAAAALVERMARPAAPVGRAGLMLLAAPVLLALAVIGEAMALPSSQWLTSLVGSNSRVCLTAIPLMSLPPLGAAIWALRAGAPLRPGLTGAAAGLLAGALAAALYATHCTDDSPLFVATWYSIALAGVTALGAAAGRIWLRW